MITKPDAILLLRTKYPLLLSLHYTQPSLSPTRLALTWRLKLSNDVSFENLTGSTYRKLVYLSLGGRVGKDDVDSPHLGQNGAKAEGIAQGKQPGTNLGDENKGTIIQHYINTSTNTTEQ